MSFPTGEQKHEIIIVKRGGGDHDGHHGGVWKIAFADFMTAMMCFFLVMWLINAANEQTKASVASYFNPVRLIDRNSSRKGLEDIGDGPNSVGSSDENPQNTDGKAGTDGQARAGPKDETHSADTNDDVVHSDEHLFADPYAVLAEIVAETGTQANVSAKGEGGAQIAGPATGASGGESFRDPFAPDFWTQQVAGTDTAEGSKGEGDSEIDGDGTDSAGGRGTQGAVDAGAEAVSPATMAPNEAAADAAVVAGAAKPSAEEAASIDPPVPTPAPREAVSGEAGREAAMPELVGAAPAAPLPAPPPAPSAQPEGPSEKAIREAAEIKRELAKAFETDMRMLDGISVMPTTRGVVISVTDQIDFGMFEIGSAVPRRETILAMEKIARTLEGRVGTLRIDGHTDARPFKSDAYDNWRLSTARAHSAYYMLVRAGVDEKRITEVGGMADRKPKVSADPMAAANRRIEILLEVAG
ncbi:MAG: MotB family protein [Rhizobiaceae bacterium]